MADGTVGIKQANDADRLIDNEVVVNDVGATVYRQKVVASLDAASLAALETTELGAASLAALETTSLGESSAFIGYTSQSTSFLAGSGKMFSVGAGVTAGLSATSYYFFWRVPQAATATPFSLRSVHVSATSSTTVHLLENPSNPSPLTDLTERNRRIQLSGNPTAQVTTHEQVGNLGTHEGPIASVIAGTTSTDLLGGFPIQVTPRAAGANDVVVWVPAVTANSTFRLTAVWSEGS